MPFDISTILADVLARAQTNTRLQGPTYRDKATGAQILTSAQDAELRKAASASFDPPAGTLPSDAPGTSPASFDVPPDVAPAQAAGTAPASFTAPPEVLPPAAPAPAAAPTAAASTPTAEPPAFGDVRELFNFKLEDLVPPDILAKLNERAQGSTGWKDFARHLSMAALAGFDPAITRQLIMADEADQEQAQNALANLYFQVGLANKEGARQAAMALREEDRQTHQQQIAEGKQAAAEYEARLREVGDLQQHAVGVDIGAPSEAELRDGAAYQRWYAKAVKKIAADTAVERLHTEIPKMAEIAAKTGIDTTSAVEDRLARLGIKPGDPRYAEMMGSFRLAAKGAQDKLRAETDYRRKLMDESQSRIAKNQAISDSLVAKTEQAQRQADRMEMADKSRLLDRILAQERTTQDRIAIAGARLAEAGDDAELKRHWTEQIEAYHDQLIRLQEARLNLADTLTVPTARVQDTLQQEWPALLAQMGVQDVGDLDPDSQEAFYTHLLATVWTKTGGALEDVATLLDSGPAGKSLLDQLAGQDVVLSPDIQAQAQQWINAQMAPKEPADADTVQP